VTVNNWVEFYLAVSVLSLFGTFLFAGRVIGSGTAAMQQIAAAIKKGAAPFLKRRYTTVAAVLGMGLLLPALAPAVAYAQPEHAAAEAKPTWYCRI